jgi:hypothetical protein
MKHIEIWRKHVDNMGIFYGIQFKSFDGVSGVFFFFQCDYQGMGDFSIYQGIGRTTGI